MEVDYYFLPNVPDEESPLASGMAPAREAESAGGMTEVPQGRGFAPSARWDFSFQSDSFNKLMECLSIFHPIMSGLGPKLKSGKS
jgi:hypothetical protein